MTKATANFLRMIIGKILWLLAFTYENPYESEDVVKSYPGKTTHIHARFY